MPDLTDSDVAEIESYLSRTCDDMLGGVSTNLARYRELAEPTRKNGQTANRQKTEFTGPFEIRTSAMTCGY